MKISVLGNIIETENIYKIGKIQLINHYNQSYGFEIEFFGKQKLEIKLSVYRLITNEIGKIIDHNLPHLKSNEELEKWIIEKKNIILKQLDLVRNEIIKYWTGNQSQIPQIEFVDF